MKDLIEKNKISYNELYSKADTYLKKTKKLGDEIKKISEENEKIKKEKEDLNKLLTL